ncbi:MAG: hypothetical protein ACE5NN_02610 [Candidatus Bathyarchaeia archaeon]
MGKLQARIRTSFGEIVVEEDCAEDLLRTIKTLPKNFVNELEFIVSAKTGSTMRTILNTIIEFTKEGPIIVSKAKLTHYEAIGLILYASDERANTARQIDKLLEYAGIRPKTSSRLNEMAKRGVVYKPNPSEPIWRLTAQGEKWIRETVLPRVSEES